MPKTKTRPTSARPQGLKVLSKPPRGDIIKRKPIRSGEKIAGEEDEKNL